MRRIVVTTLFVLSMFALSLGGGALAAEPVDDRPVATAGERVAETQQRRKPSGFWTGTRPAKGGAYRYRLMAVGAGVLAISVFFTVRFIRKQSREAE